MELGLVQSIPMMRREEHSPSERYNDDPFFQEILKESKSRFPAKTLLGHSFVSPRIAFETRNSGMFNSPRLSPK